MSIVAYLTGAGKDFVDEHGNSFKTQKEVMKYCQQICGNVEFVASPNDSCQYIVHPTHKEPSSALKKSKSCQAQNVSFAQFEQQLHEHQACSGGSAGGRSSPSGHTELAHYSSNSLFGSPSDSILQRRPSTDEQGTTTPHWRTREEYDAEVAASHDYQNWSNGDLQREVESLNKEINRLQTRSRQTNVNQAELDQINWDLRKAISKRDAAQRVLNQRASSGTTAGRMREEYDAEGAANHDYQNWSNADLQREVESLNKEINRLQTRSKQTNVAQAELDQINWELRKATAKRDAAQRVLNQRASSGTTSGSSSSTYNRGTSGYQGTTSMPSSSSSSSSSYGGAGGGYIGTGTSSSYNNPSGSTYGTGTSSGYGYGTSGGSGSSTSNGYNGYNGSNNNTYNGTRSMGSSSSVGTNGTGRAEEINRKEQELAQARDDAQRRGVNPNTDPRVQQVQQQLNSLKQQQSTAVWQSSQPEAEMEPKKRRAGRPKGKKTRRRKNTGYTKKKRSSKPKSSTSYENEQAQEAAQSSGGEAGLRRSKRLMEMEKAEFQAQQEEEAERDYSGESDSDWVNEDENDRWRNPEEEDEYQGESDEDWSEEMGTQGSGTGTQKPRRAASTGKKGKSKSKSKGKGKGKGKGKQGRKKGTRKAKTTGGKKKSTSKGKRGKGKTRGKGKGKGKGKKKATTQENGRGRSRERQSLRD
jgi:hypothetical protein